MFQQAPLPTAPGDESIADVRAAFVGNIHGLRRVGSRVTCNPAPVGTDEDWLLLSHRDPAERMLALGFVQDKGTKFYTGNDNGSFRSWRRGDVNIITTPDPTFYELFLTATELARRFNLLAKADRIALFQAVLYGVRVGDLVHERDYADAPVIAEEIALLG